ncbi:unnamed protein product [Acanthoscelides obtectus]|uniref:Uncharacterized protein n=1 Tax=Acanthoscelides obtectus TaxID=200917 RepID=A0A9P0LYC0_ACAOB|nr:unnamed protein product [Acanthoscelides obtectus]CAK1630023.1 hypothetical protein AOBTE_LOCUS6108 [Acanthoscelides obtectus]
MYARRVLFCVLAIAATFGNGMGLGMADRCLTCQDENCEMAVLAKCDISSVSSVPELGISTEKARAFGCLDLEYKENSDTKKLKRCIGLSDEDICKTAQRKLKVNKCEVSKPTQTGRFSYYLQEENLDAIMKSSETTPTSTKGTKPSKHDTSTETTIPSTTKGSKGTTLKPVPSTKATVPSTTKASKSTTSEPVTSPQTSQKTSPEATTEKSTTSKPATTTKESETTTSNSETTTETRETTTSKTNSASSIITSKLSGLTIVTIVLCYLM